MNELVGNVLVVEDEPAIRDVVVTALRHRGHSVQEAADGVSGLGLASVESYDLLILDVMMPGLDGFEVCRRLRSDGTSTPVIFLTARDGDKDRIRGFQEGGDDYVTKPFNVEELLLRVQVILRRHGVENTDELRIGDLRIVPAAHRVTRAGEPVELSPTEFRLLHYLVRNQGIVLSKAQILEEIWEDEFNGRDNSVETYISYLRRKIDRGEHALIHTVRGVGYVVRES